MKRRSAWSRVQPSVRVTPVTVSGESTRHEHLRGVDRLACGLLLERGERPIIE
jgi:hypothetical protein